MSLQLHYTGQDYINRGLAGGTLTPGSTSAIVGGCKTGSGFAFDGTSDSPLLSTNTLSSSALSSVSFWVNLSSLGTNASLFCLEQGVSINYLIRIRLIDGNKRFSVLVRNASGVIREMNGTTLVEQGKSYNITVTKNENTRKVTLYVNSVLENEMTYHEGTITATNRYVIGKRNLTGNTERFHGQICNFKYYDHVLSQKEINDDYRSLILHYPLNKAITDTVLDVSGFQRHITVIENTTTNSTTEKRVYGGSLANDGTKSLYGSLNLSELNGINEISIAVRFRFISQAGFHCYFASRTTYVDDSNGITLFKLGGSSRNVYVDIAGRNAFTLPYDLVTGTWYDLVAVKSTTDVKLYINGVLINIIANANSISKMGQLYASIGRSIADDVLTLGNQMNGNVQDIRFYATALTEDDVKDLYNVRHSIDNQGNYYTYELIEGETGVGMKKNGQTNCDDLIEENGEFRIKNDSTIKVNNFKEI